MQWTATATESLSDLILVQPTAGKYVVSVHSSRLFLTRRSIAYAFSTKPEQIYPITEWPGAQGRSVPKTPTVLKYDANNNFQWGYQLDRTAEQKIVGIKLLLDPDQERPLFDSAGAVATKAELNKLGKPPVDVASDYISAIYKHAMDKIESKMPKEYFAMLDKQFVLSVPAVWSDKAKDTTMKVQLLSTCC